MNQNGNTIDGGLIDFGDFVTEYKRNSFLSAKNENNYICDHEKKIIEEIQTIQIINNPIIIAIILYGI